MYELELTNACYKLLKDVFQLKAGESVAITCDTESDMNVVNAAAEAVFALAGKPLVLKMPTPRAAGKAGDEDLPVQALVMTIKGCEAWLELNGKSLNGSTAYEKIVADPQDRPRYVNLSGVSAEKLAKNEVEIKLYA